MLNGIYIRIHYTADDHCQLMFFAVQTSTLRYYAMRTPRAQFSDNAAVTQFVQ